MTKGMSHTQTSCQVFELGGSYVEGWMIWFQEGEVYLSQWVVSIVHYLIIFINILFIVIILFSFIFTIKVFLSQHTGFI